MTRLGITLAGLLALSACSNNSNDDLKKQVAQLQQQTADQAKVIAQLSQQVQVLNDRNAAAAQALSPPPAAPPAQGAPAAVGAPSTAQAPSQIQLGTLSMHTSPSALAVTTVGGQSWARSTPFEDVQIPAGKYTFRVRNEGLGWEKTVDVDIKAGHRTVVENLKLNP